jgi:coenzyme PQQ biosynthesis protein PqqD
MDAELVSREFVTPALDAKPRLRVGVRMNEQGQQPRMLLMADGSLQLRGPSLEIVQLCDGNHTVEQIAAKLQASYSKAEPDRVTADVLRYLTLLHEQKAIEF